MAALPIIIVNWERYTKYMIGGGDSPWEVRVGLVGEPGLGKTTFRHLCTYHDATDSNSRKERPMRDKDDFYCGSYDYVHKGKHTMFKTKIWDEANNEPPIGKPVYWFEEAAAILIFFDLSKHHTFECIDQWLQQIRTWTASCSGDIFPKVFVIGNKSDLPRAVTREEIKIMCSDLRVSYFEISCSTERGVEECWHSIIQEVYTDLEMLADAKHKALSTSNSTSTTTAADHCSLS
ncbi:hypothetical protein Pelo_3183 [Pelomyxa schiedti]|nr:hypothetical protein Pelo_3183 [Pelomyxa schiedti]